MPQLVVSKNTAVIAVLILIPILIVMRTHSFVGVSEENHSI